MVLVSIDESAITIVENGKRLVIPCNAELYNSLKGSSKEDIINWYKQRR